MLPGALAHHGQQSLQPSFPTDHLFDARREHHAKGWGPLRMLANIMRNKLSSGRDGFSFEFPGQVDLAGTSDGGVATGNVPYGESPRFLMRLQILKRRSHERVEEVFPKALELASHLVRAYQGEYRRYWPPRTQADPGRKPMLRKVITTYTLRFYR
jgi:hypothetical protein